MHSLTVLAPTLGDEDDYPHFAGRETEAETPSHQLISSRQSVNLDHSSRVRSHASRTSQCLFHEWQGGRPVRPPSPLAEGAPHPITRPRRWMRCSAGVARGEGTRRCLDSWRGFPRFQGMERFTSSGKNSQFCGRGKEQGVSPAWFTSKYIVLLLIASPIHSWRFS